MNIEKSGGRQKSENGNKERKYDGETAKDSTVYQPSKKKKRKKSKKSDKSRSNSHTINPN